mmetsp:Transcript_71566/g.202181  ORF Transcript_71566/g.202181 Transcript_71566/m.202181 type:complete len:259 (+) Transcript_71566:72-848(+)
MAAAAAPSPLVDAMFTVLTGARQGLSYGTKIRLPHALVMTLLFKKGTLESKVKGIINMAFIHARNLALFVACYKASLLGLGAVDSPAGLTPGRPSRDWHPALAGALGGYLVWGNYSSVNYQISLYVLSRVLISSMKLAAQKQLKPFKHFSFEQVYPVGAAAVWAAVMYLWEQHPALLQPSLRTSMDFLYRDGDPDALDRRRGLLARLRPSNAALGVLAFTLLASLPEADGGASKDRRGGGASASGAVRGGGGEAVPVR